MENRKSGILLHITSLPSDYGVGDLGPTAYRFVDFLQQAGQGYSPFQFSLQQSLGLCIQQLFHQPGTYGEGWMDLAIGY